MIRRVYKFMENFKPIGPDLVLRIPYCISKLRNTHKETSFLDNAAVRSLEVRCQHRSATSQLGPDLVDSRSAMQLQDMALGLDSPTESL